MTTGATAAQQQRNEALAVLLLATIGLTFIGLLAVAGFTVMAQRRLRALGMIGAIGATDRQVRRVMLANGAAVGAVGATAGAVAGLAVWFALTTGVRASRRPSHRSAQASLVGRRRWSRPWRLRPRSPRPGGRPGPLPGCRSWRRCPGDQLHPNPRTGSRCSARCSPRVASSLLVLAHAEHPVLIVTGILAITAGMLLLAPLGIRGLAATARRAPVAVRLALRDLARYQARSGAALAATSLAVGIAATIAISAAAEQASDHSLSGGNLPTNQLIVWVKGNPIDGGGPGAVVAAGTGSGAASGPSPAAIATARSTANSIGQSLNAQHLLELDTASNPHSDAPAGAPPDARWANLAQPVTENGHKGFTLVATPFVATPAILDLYRIPVSAIEPSADVLTARTDLSGTRVNAGLDTSFQPAKIQVTKLLPNYTSAPNTLLTERTVTALGLTLQPVGWLVQTNQPLTAGQITDARTEPPLLGSPSRRAPRVTTPLSSYATTQQSPACCSRWPCWL